jgi:hypothetical protein
VPENPLRYFEVDISDFSSSAGDTGYLGFAHGVPDGEPISLSVKWGVTYFGFKYADGVQTNPFENSDSNRPQWVNPTRLRFAVNARTGQMWVGKNATWLRPTGDPASPTLNPTNGLEPVFTNLTGPLTILLGYVPTVTAAAGFTFRLGADDFMETVPPGYGPWSDRSTPIIFRPPHNATNPDVNAWGLAPPSYSLNALVYTPPPDIGFRAQWLVSTRSILARYT